jgi:tRNA pseudouridine38-40 synthase
VSIDPGGPDGDVTSSEERRRVEARRLALLLEYDGTRYNGFQWQVGVLTIQDEVERALGKFTGEDIRIRGASRTDSGAHARGQVVDFLTAAPYTIDTFPRALNANLPRDIRVRGAAQVGLEFDARRHAVSRVYLYTVLNTRGPSALLRNYSHWVPGSLDLPRMQEAADHLCGTRDFSALTAPLPPERSPVRRVTRWDVRRVEDRVLIEAEANGFLPHQIRRTNGVLVNVGLGKLETDITKRLTNGSLREMRNCPSLPAKGLCLMRVVYPEPIICDENGDETR